MQQHQYPHQLRQNILDASIFTNDPHLLVYGMLASLLAAGFWLMIASSYCKLVKIKSDIYFSFVLQIDQNQTKYLFLLRIANS
jgi:hypothetical protein